ncbi:MAG: hypothetical protein HY301_17835 [Verrucomicrobia bacterium]|nr:hypothetical protein [Verrucomicrobiota bacterium]
MIQLSNDCLVFQLSDGQAIPCSVERFTLELVGDAAAQVDPEIIRNAASAVLHYFREELGRTAVTLGEFTQALERVLRTFGLSVTAVPTADYSEPDAQLAPVPAEAAALDLLTAESGEMCELLFFNRLRSAMRERLGTSPSLVRFTGLRRCAKTLVGAQRWCPRSARMSEQIVDFMRDCLTAEAQGAQCALWVK